ncbi:DNA-binding protein [Halobacteriales archaeon QS_1_68_17]|nr:MAG: DNA-binding protein [Halobacteriales archaeon QS_1_68_17]
MTVGEPATVLIVDDEPNVADAYAAQLRGEYDVSVAYSGEGALDELDERVDIVLLDRRMPGLSGDEVLRRVREEDIDCRVAMVTAVNPDFDIIDMPFDDYISKPVTQDDLLGIIDRLLTCAAYERQLQEYYALSSKHATLVANKTEAELAQSDEFAELERRRVALRERLDETITKFESEHFATVFRELHTDWLAGRAAGE